VNRASWIRALRAPKTAPVLFVAVALATAGCAVSWRRAPAPEEAARAVVHTKSGNARIRAIDGRGVSTWFYTFKLAPGRHTLEVFRKSSGSHDTCFIDFEATPGAVYWVKAATWRGGSGEKPTGRHSSPWAAWLDAGPSWERSVDRAVARCRFRPRDEMRALR